MWRYWIWQILGWGGLAVSLSVMGIASDPGLYRRVWVLDWLCMAGAGIIASHCLRALLLRADRRPAGIRLFGWILVRFAPAAALMWFLRGLLVKFTEPSPFDNPQWDAALYGIETVIMLGAWTAIALGVDYYQCYHAGLESQFQTRAALKEAQLQALRTQVNPHFLFNSLNTARSLIPLDSPGARQALTHLSELLRVSLTAESEATVQFGRELELADKYLALQALRFEGRFTLRRHVDPEAASWPVPPLILQGLVENAVKFGIEPREAPGEISLAAEIVESRLLHVVITNPGRLGAVSSSTGLGLRNARERLALLYGPAASLRLHQAAPDIVTAELILPRHGASAA